MKILFLGPKDSPLIPFLKKEDEVFQTMDEIPDERFDFLISYGYRQVLKKDVLDKFPNRAINLHISYLPWNRGADPNLWSNIEGTPSGVTIHYLDEGIDTGDIIAQTKVEFEETDTLRTSYDKLQSALQKLFYQNWEAIKKGICNRTPQPHKGSFREAKAKDKIYLPDGWDTLLSDLEGDPITVHV